MIIFDKVKWKNCLSYGNKFSEYQFKNGLTRIIGKSGDGKSTLIDVISFALFNKPYRKIVINKFINTINKKNLVVILDFYKDNTKYTIERGLKPNIFKIYKNDKLIDMDSKNLKYQEYLEKNILEFDENYFNQVMVKSLTKKISFFDATKQEKRNIINTLFGIEKLEKLKLVVKEKIVKFKTNYQILEKEKQNIQLLIEKENETIAQLKQMKQDFEKKKQEKIDKLQKELDEYANKLLDYNEKIERFLKYEKLHDTLNEKFKEIKKTKKDLEKLIMKKEIELENATKMYDNMYPICGNCPKLKLVTKKDDNQEEEIKKLKEEFTKVEDKYQDLLEKVDKVNQKIILKEKLFIKKNEIEKTIDRLNAQIKDLEKEEMNENIEEKEEFLIEQQNRYDNVVKEIKRVKEVLKLLTIAKDEILSDNGVKQYILKQYLPVINKYLNYYLEKFEFPINIVINEDLTENVLSRFKDSYTYNNFSEGEKKKIDLSLLFAFFEFSQLKNKNIKTNLLLLDEITSGLDSNSEDNLYYILREISTNKETITISHSVGIDKTIFDRIFEVKKTNKFSIIELME